MGETIFYTPDRALAAGLPEGLIETNVITLGPTGGVMMHLADQATPTELALKGAQGGRTYIGPAEDPPGSAQDREVVLFNGRILILRWMDTEVQGRYGTMVYVRCGGEGGRMWRPSRALPPSPKRHRHRRRRRDNLGVGWQFRHDPLSGHLMGLITDI